MAVLGYPQFMEHLNPHCSDPLAKIIHSPEERVEVWNPDSELEEWNQANILYDSGSTVSVAEVGLGTHSVDQSSELLGPQAATGPGTPI